MYNTKTEQQSFNFCVNYWLLLKLHITTDRYTHQPVNMITAIYLYRAAQNFGGRKNWRISSEPPKFYPLNSVNPRISESLFKQPPKFYPPIISHL